MKKLALLLALLTAAAIIAAIPVSAASTDVLKGTPILDGKVDEIYKQSAAYEINTDNQVYNDGAEFSDCPELKAATYMLYDDTYVYIVCEVTDATLNSVGADTVQAGYVWQNDVTEFWISLDGGENWGQFNFDAFGHGIGVGVPADPFADAEGCKGAATQSADGYVTEVAFSHGGLAAGAEFCQQTQVNNILAADATQIVCIGAQKDDSRVFKLSDKEAVPPVIEVEEEPAPVEEAPAEVPAEAPPAAETAAAPAAPAPAAQTGDIAAILILAAIAAIGSAAAVSKKR